MNASIPFDLFARREYVRPKRMQTLHSSSDPAGRLVVGQIAWRQSGFLTLVQVTSLFIGKHIIINMVSPTSSSLQYYSV